MKLMLETWKQHLNLHINLLSSIDKYQFQFIKIRIKTMSKMKIKKTKNFRTLLIWAFQDVL